MTLHIKILENLGEIWTRFAHTTHQNQCLSGLSDTVQYNTVQYNTIHYNTIKSYPTIENVSSTPEDAETAADAALHCTHPSIKDLYAAFD